MTKLIYGRIFSRMPGAGWLTAAALAFFTFCGITPVVRGETIQSEPGAAEFAGQVNLSEVARQEALQPPIFTKGPKPERAPHPLIFKPLPAGADTPKLRDAKARKASCQLSTTLSSASPLQALATVSPEPTPPPSASFAGVVDNGARYEANPQGAVGSNHLMVVTENQIRYQNRAGDQVGTATLDGFWSRVGASNVFSPHLLYDPYRARWIMAARAFPTTNTSKILLGVSQTSDPTGNWNLYSSNIVSPKFPDTINLGFNKNWIVVQSDMANDTNGALVNSSLFIFNKTNIYAGGTSRICTYIALTPDVDVSGHVPAITYDPTLETLNLMAVWNPNDGYGFGWLRIYQIWGPVNSETVYKPPYPGGFAWGDAWEDAPPNWDDFLPQAGVTNKLYAGDSRLQTVVYRNASLWATHTIFLPTNNPTRSVVQYWEVLQGGDVTQKGQVENLSGTFYAYPSLTVNRNNDALIGYTRFSSSQYPSASYSYHSELDSFNSLRADTLIKAGQAPYVKNDSNRWNQNYWGSYSAAVIDPLNDTDMWTLQPYASTNVNGQGRWGTWWARITPPADLVVSISSPSSILAGNTMTNLIYLTNSRLARIEDVVVTNTLPPGAGFVSATLSQGTAVFSNGQVICNLGPMDDKSFATVSVILSPVTIGQVTNLVRAGCRGPEITPANNVDTAVTTVMPTADLTVSASSNPSVVNVGSTLTNTVQVTNRGPFTATGVMVTNTFSSGMTFVSYSATMGSVTQTGNTVVWNVNNNLGVGANPTLSFVLTATAPGQLTNRAVVTGTSIDLQPGNNSATSLARANALPSMQALTARTINEDASTGPISFTVGDVETPAASLTVFAISSNESLVPNVPANISLAGSGANRTITVTPLPTLFGNATITRYVVDSDGATNSSAFVLTVAPVNDPPTLNPLSNLTLNEDAPTQTVPLSGITGGPANELQTVSISATSSVPSIIGPVTMNYTGGATGSLSFIPVTNAFGTATVTVTVNDGGTSNNFASQSFTVTINPVNDLPTLNPLSNVVLNEDAGLQTNALTGISAGPPNESQAPTITASNSNPALLTGLTVNYSSGASGTLTYSTIPNAFGSASITVTVDDNTGSNSIVSRTFDVTVNPVNDIPALDAIPDLIVLEDAASQTISLTGITSGAPNESQSLSVTANNTGSGLITTPSVSYVSPNSTGALNFDLLPHAFGTNLLTVRVQDDGSSNNVVTRTFKVIVIPVNDLPTLDSLPALSLNEDFGAYTVGLTGITAGPANEPAGNLTLTASSDNLSLIAAPIVNYTAPAGTGSIQLNSVEDASGTANITVTVNDGGTSNNIITRTFQVTVNPVNDLPTLNPIANMTILEDAGLQTINLGGIASGAANETQVLSVTASNSNPGLLTNVQVSYTSPASTAVLSFGTVSNAFGSGTITVSVNDATGSNNIVNQSFTVSVTPVNDPPTIDIPATVTLDEDFGSHTITLTGISAGPPNEPQVSLTLSATSSAPAIIANPVVVNYSPGSSTATLQLNSLPNGYGTTTISVRLNDGLASNNITSCAFTVNVRFVNRIPVLSQIPDQVMDENSSLTVPFTVWDRETPVNNLILSAISFNEEVITPARVSFSGTGTNRTMTLRPLTNQFGSATLAIMAQDADGGSANSTFELTVNFVNTPPMISPIPTQNMNEDSSLTIPFTVSDTVTLFSNIVITAENSNPTLLPSSGFTLTRTTTNCLLSLTPAANQFGAATVTITADNRGINNNISTATFTVNVSPVNDLPTLNPIADLNLREDAGLQVITLTGIGAGPANEPQSNLVITAVSANTNLVPNPNVSYTNGLSTAVLKFTPVPNAFGATTVTVTLNDNGASNNLVIRTFNVALNPENDPPTLGPISNLNLNEDAGLQTVNITGISAGFSNEIQLLELTASNSNPALLTNIQVTYASPASSGTLTFGTVSNISGIATITVTVNDNGGSNNLVSQSFTVTVNPVNDAPTLNPISNLVLDEDFGSYTVNLAGIASGAENEAQTLTLTATSSNLAVIANPVVNYVSPAANGTLQLHSVSNSFGTAAITVTVNDGSPSNNIITRTFTVTVNSINDLPNISSIANQTIDEDTSVTIPFVIGDNETAAASLTLSNSFSNPALLSSNSFSFGGSGSNRTVTIRPLTNHFGTAVVTFTVRDADGGSAGTTFNFTVNPVNDPPAISTITAQSTPANTPAVVNFIIGDPENAAGDLLLAGSSSNPSLLPQSGILFGGSNSNRTVTLAPLLNQTGVGTISITVLDTNGASTVTSFVLTVTPANTPPAISALPNLTINEDTVAGPLSFTLSDSGTALSNLVMSSSSSTPALVPPANIIFAGTGPDRTVTITPAANQFGSSTITLTVSDSVNSNSTSFVLTVAPVNDPPTLNALSNVSINEDAGLQTVNLSGISTGAANESGPIVITATSSNPSLIPNPTVNYTSPNATGTLTFTPVTHASGSTLITVTVNDNGGINNLNTRTFTVTVNPVNSTPTISAISPQITLEDTSISVPFIVGDRENPALALSVTASSTNTTLVPNANLYVNGNASNRTVTVLPATNQFGTTLITLTVSDGTASSSASFLLTVAAVNDPPTLNPIPPVFVKAGNNPGSSTVNLTGISSGASNENQTLSISVSTSSSNFFAIQPAVSYTSPTASGTLTFTPAKNITGTNLITVSVSDGGTSNNIVRQSFLVYSRSSSFNPPAVSGIANQTTSENTPTAAIPFTVPTGTLTIVGLSSNPLLVPNTNIVFGGSGTTRTVTLIPATDATGLAVVTVSVTDANYAGTNIVFTLTVNPVNSGPVISTFNNLTINEDTSTAPIAFTVSDAEVPAANLTVTANSSSQILVPNSNIVLGGSGTNRALLITPAANQAGAATITVTVMDGVTSRSNSFVLTVTGMNDSPTLSAIADQRTTQGTAIPAIPITIGDIETAAASLVLTPASSNTALIPNANITFGGSGSNRTVILTPLANQVGSSTITITVSDGQGGSVSDVFLLTVDPANTPPTLNPVGDLLISRAPGSNSVLLTLSGITAGGESQTLNVTASSSNPALVPNPVVNYTSPNSTGTLTLNALGISNGTTLITVTVNDGQAPNNITTRAFNVTVNGLPSLSSIPVQITTEDTPTAAIPFNVADSETPAANLSVAAYSRNAALVPNSNIQLGGSGSNRTVRVTPASKAFGSTWIDLAVTDANGAVVSNSFLLEVLWVNNPPTMDTIPNQVLDEDFGQHDILLTGISAGAPNELQTLTITINSTNPAVVPNPVLLYTNDNTTGYLRLTSLANVSGTSLITVQLDDNTGDNSIFSQSFLVTVRPINDPPTLAPISDLTIDEDSGLHSVAFSGISPGPADENQTLLVTASTGTPALVTNVQVSYTSPASAGTLTFGTVSNAFGSATINVTVNDQGPSNNIITRSFTVNITPVNDSPTISNIPDATTDEDVALTIPFTVFDPETSAANLLYTAVSYNQEVIIDSGITFGGTGTNRTVTLQPLPQQSGVATIVVTVQDPAGASVSSRAFDVTVVPINDPPTISAIPAQTMDEDSSITVAFSISDLESREQDLQVTANSHNTPLVPNSGLIVSRTSTNCLLSISPTNNQFGLADITITVNDRATSSNLTTRTFTLTVNPVNDQPSLDSISDLTLNENSSLQTVSLLGITSGAPNESQTLTVTASNSNPALLTGLQVNYTNPNRTGNLTFTPAPGQSGTALITVTVHDNGGTANDGQDTVSRTFRVTVNPSTTNAIALSIRKAGNRLVLAWPTNAGPCELQAKQDCAPTNTWSTLGLTPVIVSGEYQVTVDPTGPSKIYRLLRQPATAPSLNISPSGGAVLLSWSTNTTGYVLQARTNLTSATWTTLSVNPAISNGQNNVSFSVNPAISNGQNNVSFSITGSAKYYRLFHQ